MLKLNNEKLLEESGISFETMEDCFLYVSSLIDYLESHNKNYNKEQYHRILTLKNICRAIEIE